MRLCEDCRHAYRDPQHIIDAVRCALPPKKGEPVDPVTGGSRWQFARTRRDWGACGADGKYWEPKPPSLLQRLAAWVTT